MRSIQHPMCNDVLVGYPAQGVSNLYIVRGKLEDGTPVVQSVWQPDEREKKLIAQGKPILFQSLGVTHPPIAIGVVEEQ